MTNDEREAWAPLIAERREQLGLTQEQLGRAAGVAEKTVYNIEAGGRRPQTRTLRKVQRALGLTTDFDVARMMVRRWNIEEQADQHALASSRAASEALASAIALTRRERLWSAIRSRHLGDSRGLMEVIRTILEALDAEAVDQVYDALVEPGGNGFDLRLTTKQYQQDYYRGVAAKIEVESGFEDISTEPVPEHDRQQPPAQQG